MFTKPLVAAAPLAAMLWLALAPASARADECVCVNASMGMRAETRVLQSVEVGPFFSSDGATLTSEVPQLEEASAQDEGGDVMWCVSADDPRCSPRDSLPNHGFSALDATHVASGSVQTPRVGPPSPDGFGSGADLGAPRNGVRSRVERPPAR